MFSYYFVTTLICHIGVFVEIKFVYLCMFHMTYHYKYQQSLQTFKGLLKKLISLRILNSNRQVAEAIQFCSGNKSNYFLISY